MCAIVPAGNGGRSRRMPVALGPCAVDGVCVGVVATAAAAVVAALLATGLALPQAEWLAVPERIEEMKHRPRDAWAHLFGLMLTLCGLDTVNDLAGVGKTEGPSRRRFLALALKCTMVGALLLLATAPALTQDRPDALDASVLPLAGSEYAGQWAEIFVGAIGAYLLWSAATLPAAIALILQRLLARPAFVRSSASGPSTLTTRSAFRRSTRYDA